MFKPQFIVAKLPVVYPQEMLFKEKLIVELQLVVLLDKLFI